MNKINLLINILLSCIILSCTNGEKLSNKSKSIKEPITENSKFTLSPINHIIIKRSDNASTIPIGREIKFTFNIKEDAPAIDSLQFLINGKITNRIKSENEFTWVTKSLKTGKNNIKIITYYNDFTKEEKSYTYLLISDIIPKNYTYKIIKTYPHDNKAYTQGLVWENNILYEGTGRNGASSLRKINIEKGEILHSLNLSYEIFGEGICIFKDKIYQLTWRSNKGFVYNKSDFKLIKEYIYFTEGWGLTTNGTYLIMSDGSNILYYINPEFFTEEKRIEVYDNNGPVNALNELEFIDNKIYANIYGQDFIVIINPENGKTIGKIVLDKLRPKDVPKDMDHVLNGIAYNNKPNHLLITGKLWPELYEIEIIPEN